MFVPLLNTRGFCPRQTSGLHIRSPREGCGHSVAGPNDDFAGVVAINRGLEPVTKTFRIAEDFNDSNKIYVYFYNEKELKLGEDGFVRPNQIVDGSLKDQIELNIPVGTLVILSSKEL